MILNWTWNLEKNRLWGPHRGPGFAHNISDYYLDQKCSKLKFFGIYRTENETRNLPVKKSAQSDNIKCSWIEPEIKNKSGSAATLQFPHKEAHSVTQQSEVWSPSSDMESGWACFVLLKGRLSVLGKAAHSPCWSSTFTPHFAELQSGLPCVGIGEWWQSPFFLNFWFNLGALNVAWLSWFFH